MSVSAYCVHKRACIFEESTDAFPTTLLSHDLFKGDKGERIDKPDEGRRQATSQQSGATFGEDEGNSA